MKLLSLLFLSLFMFSCANNNERDIASEEQQEDTQRMERAGDYGRANQK